jgi:hypothetical protein
MFSSGEVEKVVALQQKSYNLLRWVGDALRGGTLRFGAVHDGLGFAQAAREWLERSWDGLPADARPAREDLDAFAHLFASYLQTSYELVESPGRRLVSPSGCYCRFCAYLVSASHLRVRTPDRKAKEKARQMKEMYLAALATEAGDPSPYAAAERLLTDPSLAEDIAWAAYARELLRRSEFASQGEGVLVLWREIAWDLRSGRLKKNFEPSAERILRAEAAILSRLKEGSGA